MTLTQTTNALAQDLVAWDQQCSMIDQGQRVILHQPDMHVGDMRGFDLFKLHDEQSAQNLSWPIDLLPGQKLCAASFRQRLFCEIYKQHTAIDAVYFTARLTGHFLLKLECVEASGNRFCLLEEPILAGGDIERRVDLSQIPQGSQIYWSLIALEIGASILKVAWVCYAPKQVSGRMVFAVRTFGNLAALLRRLDRLKEQNEQGDFVQFLRNSLFVVLDTGVEGQGLEAEISELSQHFNVVVLQGENLGGGGNMSQLIWLITEAQNFAGVQIDEVVFLDDDVDLTLETVRRHWAVCAFRVNDVVFTAPVLDQQKPMQIWEDGAFWGRYSAENPTDKMSGLAPSLIRHGARLDDPEIWAQMAAMASFDYATFIFFSLPFSAIEQVGLPLAFFLRGDDIEYSLRLKDAGFDLVSNANLGVWHGATHSYGQEYMAIAHGIILNFGHGDQNASDVQGFFLGRAQAHLAISDYSGLELYGAVLRDLNAMSIFLEPDFAAHYPTVLVGFKQYERKFSQLPKSGRARTMFLYPETSLGMNGQRVTLYNPHCDVSWRYDPKHPMRQTRVISAAAELFAQLQIFVAQFETLQTHYVQKISVSARPEFWQKVLMQGEQHPSILHRYGSAKPCLEQRMRDVA